MASIVDDGLSNAETDADRVRHFADTLSLDRDRKRLRHGLSAPIGLLVHGVALGSILLLSLLSTQTDLAPSFNPALLSFAPPPPPTLRQGGSVEEEATQESRPVDTSTRTFVPSSLVAVIPDGMLAPSFDSNFGLEDGFEDGDVNGMPDGLAEGVVGGVPGGLPGGVVGGTGTELPRFPKPDVGPRPIRRPLPSYTEAAIREKVSGAVTLRVVIDEQGKVKVMKILRSIPELDAEAVQVVESRWRFEPATKNGRPIPCLADLVVRFNLY